MKDALDERVTELAQQLAQLPARFYDQNKQDLRRNSLRIMQEEIDTFKMAIGL